MCRRVRGLRDILGNGQRRRTRKTGTEKGRTKKEKLIAAMLRFRWFASPLFIFVSQPAGSDDCYFCFSPATLQFCGTVARGVPSVCDGR